MQDTNGGDYRRFMKKADIDKAFHTLEGILKGIALDKKINSLELKELSNWSLLYQEYVNKHPFSEIIPLTNKYLEDGILTEEEYDDLLWFTKKVLTENRYYNAVTSDIQRLEGMIHGVMADNEINEAEINQLKEWLFDNEHLSGIWPFDEIQSVIVGVTEDGIITNEEKQYLKVFFSEFINIRDSFTIDVNEIEELKKTIQISGICTLNPCVEFKLKKFCFTGASGKATRSELKQIVEKNGGIFSDSVTNDTNYLIVNCEGNPCWAFSRYGRKIEKAIDLRRNGKNISIVNEVDFWDVLVE